MISFTPTISQLKMLASLRGNLWNVHEEKAVELALAALELSEKAGKRESFYSDEALSDFYTLRKPYHKDSNGIGHIEVRGAMMHECQPIYERVGQAIRYKTLIKETHEALDDGAKGIIYHINSPGGSVLGNVEVAEMIFELEIPTLADCDGLACSAAYKIASSANVIVARKSAMMGNIGTILSWADCSEFWSKWGVNFKAIVSEGADLKSTFHLEPDEAQREFLQEGVNDAGKAFRDHVRIGRSAAGASLSDEVWRAGWYSGEKAMNLGLIDEIGDASESESIMIQMIQNANK